MPYYFPKKQTHTETQFEVHTSSNTYLLTLRTTEDSALIYIGGVSTYCVECQIFSYSQIAHLYKIEYSESFALKGKFKRGSDVLAILSILCSFIESKYPTITHIQFDDSSYRDCDESQTIDLASFYYALYEKTGYMNKFDASFAYKKDMDYFISANTAFQKLKSTMSWEQYDTYVTTCHPLPENDMKLIYDESKTWSEFFNNLKETVDISELCVYLAPWIQSFVKYVAKLNFKQYPFHIPVCNPKLVPISFTLKPYITGGGAAKYTRKRMRKRYLDLH
jgi:hypothetical protein